MRSVVSRRAHANAPAPERVVEVGRVLRAPARSRAGVAKNPVQSDDELPRGAVDRPMLDAGVGARCCDLLDPLVGPLREDERREIIAREGRAPIA